MDNIINQINEIDNIIITNNIQNQTIFENSITLLNDFDRVCRIFWNYYDEYNHGQTFPDLKINTDEVLSFAYEALPKQLAALVPLTLLFQFEIMFY